MSTTTAPTTPTTPDQAPTLPGIETDPVARLLDWALATRTSIHLIGSHGIGKTAYVTDLARRRGLRVVAKSLPVCTQRDFCVPLPVADPDTGERAVEVLVLDELLQRDPDDRYLLVLDELSRADKATLNTAMELLQEHTIAGQALPGLAAVVALDNPAGDDAYAGVETLDLAQADRVATLTVTADDIPWAAHLAHVHTRDLAGFVRVWRRLSPEERRVLCPRVLDHLLSLHAAGLPAHWALPVDATGRHLLRGDRDRTEEVLHDLTAELDGPTPSRHANVEQAIAIAITSGWKLRLVGPQGIGKTSFIRTAVAAAGLDLEYVSLSQTSASDLVVPVPINGRLDFLPARRLVEPGRRYVLVLDEFSRASADVASAAMELVNERSLAGRRLEGCHAVIALDNPPSAGRVSFDAGRIDAAQASRFTCTIELTDDDLPWREFLLSRYPESAGIFLDWRAEDLDDTARVLVSPRCLERMLSLHAAGIDPLIGLPVIDGERVPVSLGMLQRRLRGLASSGLGALVANLNDTLTQLAAGAGDSQLAALTALQTADVTLLTEHQDAIVEIVRRLEPNHRLALVRMGGRRRTLFQTVVRRVAGVAA